MLFGRLKNKVFPAPEGAKHAQCTGWGSVVKFLKSGTVRGDELRRILPDRQTAGLDEF